MQSSKINIYNEDILSSDLPLIGICDCMYTDPPWGLGNLRYWRTMNDQPKFDSNWDFFLERLKMQYKNHVIVNGPALIEMGHRFVDDVVRFFGKPDSMYTCCYNNRKNTNVLLVYRCEVMDVTGKTGNDLVYSVLSSLKPAPKSVFDPCAGKGTTLKICKKLNISCHANELIKHRYEYAKRYSNESIS